MSRIGKTALAVALTYDERSAPKVVAVGRGEFGQRIIDTAREHGVPLEANPALAEALSTIEVETEIPRELYAAAHVDGAKSALDRFFLVTWPMLGPTTLFVVTISITNAVKVFETVKMLTDGGPNKASEVLLFTIYQEGFVYLRVGYASAMTVVFLAILVVLMLVQYRVLDRRVHYT